MIDSLVFYFLYVLILNLTQKEMRAFVHLCYFSFRLIDHERTNMSCNFYWSFQLQFFFFPFLINFFLIVAYNLCKESFLNQKRISETRNINKTKIFVKVLELIALRILNFYQLFIVVCCNNLVLQLNKLVFRLMEF